MERKSFKFEVKSVDEAAGTFEGIASAFRKTPDKVKDIARPGAFKKTINENPEVPALYMHDIMSPIGIMTLSETDRGLSVKGQIIKGIQRAEESLLLMKAGVIKTLSIGYDVIQREFKDGIRYLTEVKVYEISVVIGDFATDDEAIITNVKADRSHKAPTFEENMQWNNLRSMGGRMLDTLYQTIDDIMFDAQSDKPNELDAAITAFHSAFLDWVGQAVAIGIVKADKKQFEKKVTELRETFKAILVNASKTKEKDVAADYPWDQCMSDQMDRYGDEETARRVCGAIRARKEDAVKDKLKDILVEIDKDLKLKPGNKALSRKTEPSHDTPEDGEAAGLDALLSSLKAENEGFNVREAEARMDVILAELKK